MGSLPDEIRLAVTIAVGAFVLAAGYRFSRRHAGGDVVTSASDALLIFYLVQYLAVGLTGLAGVLSAAAMLIVATALAAVLWIGKNPHPDPGPGHRERGDARRIVFVGASILVCAYLAALAWNQRAFPQMANDPLTYHLPAAVQWLEQGRITLFQTWLYNPANTYSPLAGSMFMAWLLAPIGNDALARFVQMPALLLIFVSLIELGRALGAKTWTAIVIATAAVLSRPLLSQTILAKDDLFVAAFFTAAMAGLSSARLRDRLGPWRVGAALGLMLATKYTAWLSLPLLLLAIDAPRRAGWRSRQWIILFGSAVVLAGPWYLRNLLFTGNPLYPIDLSIFGIPIFRGMFATARSPKLATFDGLWQTITQTYFKLPAILLEPLLIGWAAAVIRCGPAVAREPQLRTAVFGPILGIVLFIFISPYDELRFVYPSLVLLFACTTLAFQTLPPLVDASWAAILLVVALATNFVGDVLKQVLPVVIMLAAAGAVAVMLWPLVLRRRPARMAAAAVAGLAIVSVLYVQWPPFLAGYRQRSTDVWRAGYAPIADAWAYIRTELPPEATLAYANTYYVYPLYGFDLRRPVVYAPLRARLHQIHDLPRIPGKLSGAQINPAIAAATLAEPDGQAWLDNLRAAGAKYLLVAKRDLTNAPGQPPPPELTFAEQDPGHFHRLFDNEAAAVYEILP